MNFKLLLIVAAILFFLLDGFRVPASVNWSALAWACVVAAFGLF
jgi:hypothetical protein